MIWLIFLLGLLNIAWRVAAFILIVWFGYQIFLALAGGHV